MKMQVYVGIGLTLLLLVWQQRLPSIVKVAWLYFLAQTWFIAYSPNYAPAWGNSIGNVLAWNGAKNLLSLVLLPLVVMQISEKSKAVGLWALRAFIVVDTIWLLCGGRGVMYANTFDAAVMACLAPLFFNKKDLPFVVCAALSTVWVHSRTAYIAWGVIALVYWIPYTQIYKTKIRYILNTLTCSFVLAGLFTGVQAWIRNPRATMTVNYMAWWWESVNVWLGTGLGAFEWLGLFLPSGIGYTPYLMHNDWAQILFEGGVIGLLLATSLFIFGIFRLKHARSYQAVWCAVGTAGATYYVIHSWVIQVVMLSILFFAVDTTKNK